MKRGIIGAVLIMLMVVLSVFVSAEDWTQYGNTPGHKGKSNSFVPEYDQYNLDQDEVSITGTVSSPIVVGNNLYFSSKNDFEIMDLNANNITEKVPHGENSVSNPAYGGGKVCYGSLSTFRCANSSTGDEIWRKVENGVNFEFATPVIVGTIAGITVYVNSEKNAGGIYAYDLNNGNLKWKYQDANNDVGAYGGVAVDTAANRVYSILFDATQNKLIALNTANGTKSWEKLFASDTRHGIPSVSGERVYVALDQDSEGNPARVLALNKNTGDLIWTGQAISDTSSETFSFKRASPVEYGGKVFIAGVSGGFVGLFAFDTNNGNKIWEKVFQGDMFSSITVTDSRIVLGVKRAGKNAPQSVKAFNTETGDQMWSVNVNTDIEATPIVVNNKIHVPESASALFSYKTKNKYVNQSFQIKSNNASTAVDGKIEADALLIIAGKNDANGSLNITKLLADPGKKSFGARNLNRYVIIDDPNNVTQNNMDHAELRIYYNDDEIKELNVNESNLRMEFFNETSQKWENVTPSGVNKVDNYVWGNVTHFSTFGGDGVIKDSDNDGVSDKVDNCVFYPNPNQEDADHDGIGDICDSDQDGILDSNDNCRYSANANQLDSDNDKVGDVCDNCVNVQNKDQLNSDGDNEGNACDTDDDNDFILDADDYCPTISSGVCDSRGGSDGIECSSFSYPQHADQDNDKIGDVCDNCPAVYNPDQKDLDHDGIGSVCDPNEDSDGDGILDNVDNCPSVANPGQEDNDKDGQGDACDIDDDNDGVLDVNDNCQFIVNPGQENFDHDSLGDICDPDDDNDGFVDGKDICKETTNAAPASPVIDGCSCKQILDIKPGEDTGEMKNGCSSGTLDVFIKRIGWAKDTPKP